MLHSFCHYHNIEFKKKPSFITRHWSAMAKTLRIKNGALIYDIFVDYFMSIYVFAMLMY